LTFGIPVDTFPISANEELKNQHNLKWIGLRRKLESGHAKSFAEKAVLLPSHSDVLIGRGKPIQNHRGNLGLGLIVESLYSRYDEASKSEKAIISLETVNKVKGTGGRFLKQVEGIWVEANGEEAREKVCIAFRSFRSLRKDSNSKQFDLINRDSEKETKKRSRG
jgi:hypothetical protein